MGGRHTGRVFVIKYCDERPAPDKKCHSGAGGEGMRREENGRRRAGFARIFAAVAACFLLFSSCGGGQGGGHGSRYDTPGYAGGELRCSFTGELNGVGVSGELWVSEVTSPDVASSDVTPSDVAPGRDFVLYFTSPATMSGLEISRRAGVLTVKSGDVELSGDAIPPLTRTGWLAPIAGLYPADLRCTAATVPGQPGFLRLTFPSSPGVAVVVDGRGRPQRLEGVWGYCICSYAE